jgi:5-methylcytosine-specific restriction endonuclease McrA
MKTFKKDAMVRRLEMCRDREKAKRDKEKELPEDFVCRGMENVQKIRDEKLYRKHLKSIKHLKDQYPKAFNKYVSLVRKVGFSKVTVSIPDLDKLLKTMTCAYCLGDVKSITLDRINPGESYSLDNIEPVCKVCNTVKWNTFSREEAIFLARTYEKEYGKKFAEL